MRRILLLTSYLLLLTLSVSAAGNAAIAALDKAAAKVNINRGVTADFTFNAGAGNQSGTISAKGNKFCCTTGQAVIWYNGKTQWVLNKKTDEVNVSTPSGATSQMMNPYAVLTLYKQGYTATISNAAAGRQVHLVGKGKAISEMYILIDKAGSLKQVKMKRGGKWNTIVVSNIRAAKLADSAFTFNAKDYPKAEIIDLR